ncbi:MAG: 1-acyl-sn-glycerol-3-phosphate acyltransferase [Anaerolineae bacterium]|nr:1-acyl-sn-glycerol-3-phosphate acyltransferase [Anaerolineae bacterium]
MDQRYFRVRAVLKVLFGVLTRVEIVGLEHVPEAGGFILATNHISRLDTPLLGVACPRPVTALVAIKYRSSPFFRWFLTQVGAIWVRRTDFDREALLKSLDVLKSGGVLGIAPEGTRSPQASLQPGKPGVAFLAARVGAPIVPVAITGAERMLPDYLRLRRPRIRVVFGAPFRLPREGKLTPQELAAGTELTMRRIAALLPPAYRGVYAVQPVKV